LLRRIADFLAWLYVWLHIVLFCLLPRRLTHRIGRWLGALAFRFSARTRNVAVENLRRFLGADEEAAHRIARESCEQAGAAFVDLARAFGVTRRLVRRDIEIPDATRRAVDEIRRKGRGAVLAAAHYGNWEFQCLVGPFLSLPPMTVVVRPIRSPLFNRLLYRLRGWTGQRLIHRDGAVLTCARRVRKGECVAVTTDLAVPPDAGGAPVDFFGLPTYTTLAVGYVAALTGAPVYLWYLEPIGGCRYRCVLKGPLEAEPKGTRRETALATTRAVTRALEETIREYPAAWGWWTKRWRLIPPGAKGFPSYARAVHTVQRRRDTVADA
jgi:KDO2-lipid IV(A) lauroyltransferase